MSNDKPQIVVDDDWKSRAQAEKEQLDRELEESSAWQEMPEANFMMVVSTFATQAMIALGYVADPMSKKVTVNRDVAKHMIDTIAVLEKKTAGNLTPDEDRMIKDTLHHLRMAYVSDVQPEPVEEDSERPQGSSIIID